MLGFSGTPKPRACDQCRVRKLRCDKTDSPDSPCTPCTQNGMNCTFVQKTVVRRSAPKWYVAGLETRVERLQALVTKLHPGVRFPELESQIEVGCWTTSDRPWVSVSATSSPTPPPDPIALEEQTMEQLLLIPYYGVTDPYHTAQSAMRERFKNSDGTNDRELFQHIFSQRRSDFWLPLPWEVRLQEAWKEAQFTYPPPELATQLIDLYFDHSGALFPLLHRHTFVQNYQNKLHERDSEYGSVLLMVCAIGSRWMDDDPRVLDQRINISGPSNNAYSAGWPFYEQVQQLPRLHSPSHSLEALQCYVLSSIYLFGSSSLQVAYSILGFAMRLAQQMGLHRRTSVLINDPSPRKRELWKRLFWILVVLDRLLSSSLGRACALYDEEIDLDHPLPIEDDDWPLDPMIPLPVSSSSSTSGAYFSSMMRLTSIRVESLKKMITEDHQAWPAPTAASRQSLLNDMERQLVSFFDHLPAHLRWEPSGPNQDSIVLRQSAFIHVHYYSSFISGHRANLPEPGSLLSCVKAGRACIDVIATATAMVEDDGNSWSGLSLLASASCVQFGIWSNEPELDDKPALASAITTAIDLLSQLEKKWIGAGKYRDILRGLTSIGHTETLSQPSGSPSGNIPHAPPIEDFPSSEGTVAPGQEWRFLMNAVQNPLPDRIDQYVAPSAGPSTGSEGDPQVDIWSPPTDAAEWEAWQQFLSRQRYSAP